MLAVSGDRTPISDRPTVRPPRQVLLSASQRLDDAGGARIQAVEEGPAGRRSASGTVSWGAHDSAELTVTDELGTGRLRGRDGALDLGYTGAAPGPRTGTGRSRWTRAPSPADRPAGPAAGSPACSPTLAGRRA